MALDTIDAVVTPPEGKENPPAAPSQPAEPNKPTVPLPPPETDWKAKAEHAEQVAASYKESAEKYWQIKKSGRLNELQPVSASPVVDDAVPLDETVATTIRNDYLSKRQDVVDDFREDVLNLTEEQYQRFKPLYRAVDELYEQAAKAQRFVAKGEIGRRFKEMLSFAKGEPAKVAAEAVANARREGHIEMLKAEHADFSVTSTIPSTKDSPDVTAEDKAESAKTGGLVAPERIAEIRRSREARAKEYAA